MLGDFVGIDHLLQLQGASSSSIDLHCHHRARGRPVRVYADVARRELTGNLQGFFERGRLFPRKAGDDIDIHVFDRRAHGHFDRCKRLLDRVAPAGAAQLINVERLYSEAETIHANRFNAGQLVCRQVIRRRLHRMLNQIIQVKGRLERGLYAAKIFRLQSRRGSAAPVNTMRFVTHQGKRRPPKLDLSTKRFYIISTNAWTALELVDRNIVNPIAKQTFGTAKRDMNIDLKLFWPKRFSSRRDPIDQVFWFHE